MFAKSSIPYISLNPEIWMGLIISIASLGVYYSIILLVRDQAKGRSRTMMGLYSLCNSIILVHLVAILFWNASLYGWIQITGAVALFLLGPFSYRMIFHSPHLKGGIRNTLPFIPAGLIFGGLLLDLFPNSVIYALGLIHTGVYLFVQALRLIRRRRSSGITGWNFWYTAAQIFLCLGIGVSSLMLPGRYCFLLASAGLVVLILLIWIRLIYIAYLSYVISRS